MTPPLVVYTDPPWAVPDGRLIDPGKATIEQEVFDGAVVLRFGPFDGERFQGDAALAEQVDGAAALGVYRRQVTSELLDAAGPGLRVVARQGVGTDNLNAALLAERGIIGFNVPDYCVDEVAAHTMALTLAWERDLITQHNGLAGGAFDIYAGRVPRRLRRRTAGIVGFGRIGRAMATHLRSFYGRILACDPYVHPDLMEGYGATGVPFDRLLAESDVVLLHCALTPETRGMIDAAALKRARPGALLVNAARGALVDPAALYRALTSGDLGGAALDVFVPEDPHADPWFARVVRLPNVVVTSHRAFLSAESEESSRRRVAEGIRHVLRTGAPPPFGHVTE